MKDIQKRELIRCVKLIQSIGCSYRILSPDGDSFGDLQVVEPKTKKSRAPRKYPYGSLTKYAQDHLDLNADVGSVQEVSCANFELETLRSAACNLLTKAWGKDSYVTVGHGDRFEVMRTVGAE